MRKIFSLILGVFILFVFVNLGCSKKVEKKDELINLQPPTVPVDTVKQEPTLDLNEVKEDTIVKEGSVEKVENTITGEIESPKVPEQIVTVYRVQIHAFQDEQSATIAKKKAEEILNTKVYMDYINGWYKLRVGEFMNKLEAEDYRELLTKKGYKDAWVVECKVKK